MAVSLWLTDGMSTSSATRASKSVMGEGPSRGGAVFAEDVVQPALVVPLAFEVAHDQRAEQAELATRVGAGPRGRDDQRPRGHVPAPDFLARLRVDDGDRRAEDHAGAEERALPHARTVDHHAPRSDDAVVFDDDRRGARRLEHATDADAAGQVDIAP